LHGVVEDDAVLGDMQMDALLDALPADLQHLQCAIRDTSPSHQQVIPPPRLTLS
jgi:hypothetical protein